MSVPPRVLAAWGAEHASIEPITIGLINRTYRLDAPAIVLQRLHPIFAGEVNHDIDVVTRHLAHKGLLTPRIVPTRSGELWLREEGEIWRALTLLDGRVFAEMPHLEAAYHAGLAVGRFHRAVSDLDHTFHFVRHGVHDTRQHLDRLRTALAEGGTRAAAVQDTAEAILRHADGIPMLPTTRRRILHQDLKISNILFDSAGEQAVALLDLDTLGHGMLAHEMGDALRSWCNRAGEDADEAVIDVAIFEAALRGWGDMMREDLEPDEIATIVLGTETISIELASRFALDAMMDSYFGWDERRFPSRAAHNRARARSQLSLARSIHDARSELEEIVRAALRP